MPRYAKYPGEKRVRIASAAFAENATIFNQQKTNLPPGFGCTELSLVMDLTITVAAGGVSIATPDAILQAIAALSAGNITTELLDLTSLTGDELGFYVRQRPPRGLDVWDFCPGFSAPAVGGGATRVAAIIPILYSNAWFKGGDDDRYPTELLNVLQWTLTTNTNASWITLNGGSITGTISLWANLFPASRLILPAPLQLFREPINANTTQDWDHKDFYYETVGRFNLSGFTGTDIDSLIIGGQNLYNQLDGQMDHDDLDLLERNDNELRITTADSRYNENVYFRVLGGRMEFGDEILYNVPLSTKVQYRPESAANMIYHRRRRWSANILSLYSSVLGREIAGGNLIGPNKGDRLPFSYGAVLPLDAGSL